MFGRWVFPICGGVEIPAKKPPPPLHFSPLPTGVRPLLRQFGGRSEVNTCYVVPLSSALNTMLRRSHALIYHLATAFVSFCLSNPHVVDAWVSDGIAKGQTKCAPKSAHSRHACARKDDNYQEDELPIITLSNDEGKCKPSTTRASRRDFLTKSASSLAALVGPILLNAKDSCAAAQTNIITTDQQQPQTSLLAVPNLQCLTDLPPITPGCVRIYLCRHGQTENNRLRKVQGARVDPSLNVYGAEMASRIGMALSYLPKEVQPTVAVHSKLTRARETAQIATKTLSDIRMSSQRKTNPDVQLDPSYLVETYGQEGTISVPTLAELERTGIKDVTLPSLGEVDFGTGFDGANVEMVKAGMYATYASWSVGAIDRRMDGGGESGREVLNRAASALSSLADIAKTNGGTVLAVSHSTYLRTLLGAIMDISLAKAATMEQKNGCINVLDINVEGATAKLGPKSGLFGSSLSPVSDFDLVLPETHIIRMNEFRHLEGITWPTADAV